MVRLPAAYLRFCQSLYMTNVQRVRIGSFLSPGFVAACGVRQGCPLSPLLFATVMDLLLRRLTRRYERIVLRAFADEIGIVAQDLSVW